MTTNKIDRQSFVPPYFQLAQILEQQVLSGQFRPGDSLPSEPELCRQYELSRMTVRKCLKILSDRGLILAQPGRGTFISRQVLDRVAIAIEEFHQEMRRRGIVPEAKLISVRVEKSSPETAEALRLRQGDKVLRLTRLLLGDGEPMALESKYLRYETGRPILENELQDRAFAEVIAAHSGLLPVRSRITLRAALADSHEARYLDVAQGSPILCLEQCLYAVDGYPLGWGQFSYRGDRFQLVSETRPLSEGE